ncbi:MAG: immunoglobulin-like domain-containing protein [Candidatus Paceibacterota bacterium]
MKKILTFLIISGFFLTLCFIPSYYVSASGNISPLRIGSINNKDFDPVLAYPEWIAVSGNYAIIGSNISNAISILDISDPDNLVQVGSLFHGDGGAQLRAPTAIAISGNYAYITSADELNEGNILEIVDISDPTDPSHAGSLVFPINEYGPYGIFVSGNYVYLPVYGANCLKIIDVSDPTNPFEIGRINHGDGGANLNRPYSVYVVGNYAYVANYTGDSLEIINILDPANPVHSGLIKNGDGGAKLDGASGVSVVGNYAYVFSFNSKAMEIVDISDPTNPTHISSISNGVGGVSANGFEIYVSSNYAYLSSYYDNTLEIINISDPVNPVHSGSISDGDGGIALNHPRGIALSGTNIFIIATASNAINVIDVSDPTDPTYKSSLIPSVHLGSPNKIKILNDTYAYVLSINSNALQVINISDLSNPTPEGFLLYRFGSAQLNSPFDIAFNGNFAYIVGTNQNSNSGNLITIDVSDPANPVHLSSSIGAPFSTGAYGIEISGDYAFITAYGSDLLEIVDIATDPANPSHIASLSNGDGGALIDGPRGIYISGNYAYIASSLSDALEIVDISDPSNPTHSGSISHGDGGAKLDGPRMVLVNDNYAYVSSWDGDSIEIIDISNPTAPIHVGSIDNIEINSEIVLNPFDMHISDGYLYVSYSGLTNTFYMENGGLVIIDVSDPTNPVYVDSVMDGDGGALLNGSRGFDTIGDYILTANVSPTSNSIEIFRIKDSVMPVITMNESSTLEITKGSSYADSGATALDDVDGDLTSSIVVVNNVDTDVLGTYTVTYNVDDLSDNHATEVVRTVNVVKNHVSSGSILYGCKDINAINYNAFSSSKPELCKYNQVDNNTTIVEITSKSTEQIIEGNECSNKLIITDNLKQGDRNGKYSNYNKSIVNQVDILQNHINRILSGSYKEAAGPVDGIFGPLTKIGVERLQTYLNIILKPSPLLVVDGIVGPNTKFAINNSCGQ